MSIKGLKGKAKRLQQQARPDAAGEIRLIWGGYVVAPEGKKRPGITAPEEAAEVIQLTWGDDE